MLSSHVRDTWQTPTDQGRPLVDAATGEEVARWTSQPADPGALEHARRVGGPALRELTFHQRAGILKSLAKHLNERTGEFYEPSLWTGATPRDSAVDIDGGIGVLFVYASKGTKELPDATHVGDGAQEQIGKEGTFVAQHICTSLLGAAVQINAFNFPVWGMLEKFAPAFLAGVPSVVKPASQTAYLTESVFRRMVESGLLPAGSIQLLAAGVEDLLVHVTPQDAVAFTGSATTAQQLRAHPTAVGQATRFNAESDSLNHAVLGPDASPGTSEFELFVKAVTTEMTVKAGQKCTVIRRAFVPAAHLDDVQEAVRDRLARVIVGHPGEESVRMGALASTGQSDEVRRAVKELRTAGELVFGDPEHVDAVGADAQRGAFVSPLLLRCDDPDRPEPLGPRTSGYVVPGYELQIRDDDGNVCRQGETGSLFVKGESIALGYWARVATTRQVFQGEWLATGDTYVQDENGRYTCLGRSNDMLKSGGIWVSPGEVETRLLEHDDVVEAAVVGVPDAAGLEKPVAYVVLNDGSPATSEDLIAFCRDGLAHFKAPRTIVLLDELPRTATGKLQRFRLREMTTEPQVGV